MRFRVVRHSPLAFGLLLRRPRDAELTRHWITPAMTDGRIRQDIARFARGLDRNALVDAAPRLREFDGPVRMVWGTADRCFTVAPAAASPPRSDGELVEVPGVSTFVPIDAPDAVADAIVATTTANKSVARSLLGSEAVYLNEFADDLLPKDMRPSAEFASLLESAADLGIPHDADVRYVSRQAVVRGMRFHFTEWGNPASAPPALLLHGGNQSSHSWDLVSLHLADRFHVYALDQRGHGDTEWSRELDYSMEAMAADVLAFIADQEFEHR